MIQSANQTPFVPEDDHRPERMHPALAKGINTPRDIQESVATLLRERGSKVSTVLLNDGETEMVGS